MRKHDQKFADRDKDYRSGTWIQYLRTQLVKTPFGAMRIPCAIRVPKMNASKRQWKIWMDRFGKVVEPKNKNA